jgi:hypothetical protein
MLIVTPLFALLMGFGFWFFLIHQKQTAVYRNAREPVWATAAFACGDPGDTSKIPRATESNVSVSSGAPVYVIGANYAPIYAAVPGGPNEEVLTRKTADVRATREERLEAYPSIGTKEGTFRASAEMMCNETIRDGQANTMKRIAAGVFNP